MKTNCRPNDKNKLPKENGERLWEPSECRDNDMFCKRATSIERGYDALKAGVDYEWLVTGNEDQFIMPELTWEGFKKAPRDRPLIVSGFGCGQLWNYSHPGEEMPSDWHDPSPSCPSVEQKGGMCAGQGMSFNRKAVETFFEDGKSAFWENFNKYQRMPEGVQATAQGLNDDEGIACMAYDFKVTMLGWSSALLDVNWLSTGDKVMPDAMSVFGFDSFYGQIHVSRTSIWEGNWTVPFAMRSLYPMWTHSKHVGGAGWPRAG